jgi:hypothetical protein
LTAGPIAPYREPVIRVGRALALVAIAGAVVGLAACGGGKSGVTASTSTAPAALADRLPPQDSIPGLNPGDPKRLPTVDSLIDAFYQQGDPSRPGARARFLAGGFRQAVVRDQTGKDPAKGIGLLRTYVIQLGSPAAASREVKASVDEVKRGTKAPTSDVVVPGVPGARGLGVTVTTGGTTAHVALITFAAGRYLYGYQAFARGGADLHLADIQRSARDVYRGAGGQG